MPTAPTPPPPSDHPGPREGLSVQRAAFLLDVHEDTITRWAARGYIEIVYVGPRLRRVPRSEVARLRAARARRTTPQEDAGASGAPEHAG